MNEDDTPIGLEIEKGKSNDGKSVLEMKEELRKDRSSKRAQEEVKILNSGTVINNVLAQQKQI